MGGIGRRRLVGLLCAAGLLLAGCGGSGGGSGAGGPGRSAPATPAPATTAAVPAKACLEAGERVLGFPAADGPTAGVVLGRGRTGVVLGHQVGSDLCEWLPTARALARQGRQVLAFDFGRGGQIAEDMAAAAAELRRRGVTRLVLVGSSMGGTAAIAAAARITPPVAGVVSLSGPEDYQGTDAAAAAARLRMPVLFVAAEDDPPFDDAARALYKAVPGRDKRLLILEGGGHGTSLLEFGDQAPRARRALDRFLQATLGAA
jgi:pimeloyl-ACP methyl ester carboxylesterase